jgi:hypothetical protein
MTPSSTPRSPRVRRTAGALALTLVAAGTATAVTSLFGVAPSPAAADPGDTFVAIGSSRLMQSEDLVASQIRLNTETVDINVKGDFASCPGDGNPKSERLLKSPKALTGVWERRGHDGQALSESIAQAKTETQAKRWEKMLVSDLRACSKPNSNFYYGPTSSSGVGSGHATWVVTFSGDPVRPVGGVAVVRKGTNLGLVDVSGTWGPADQTMESVAKLATDRLG